MARQTSSLQASAPFVLGHSPSFQRGPADSFHRPGFPFPTVPAPLPDIVRQFEEYEVESVLDSQLHRGKPQYLVKWKGYPHEENTWEPEMNVTHSPDAVSSFHKAHPSAPRRISTQLPFVPYENLTEPQLAVHAWTDGKIVGLCGRMEAMLRRGTC